MTKPTELGFHAPGLDTVTMSESGVDMPVIRADGTPLKRLDGKPVILTLYGPDSKAYRTQNRLQRKRQVERASLGERTDEQRADDADEDAIVFLAGMIKGWNVQLSDGSEAPCDTPTVSRFLRAYPISRDQADQFIARRVAFMKAS
jgi:hypothetical protein